MTIFFWICRTLCRNMQAYYIDTYKISQNAESRHISEMNRSFRKWRNKYLIKLKGKCFRLVRWVKRRSRTTQLVIAKGLALIPKDNLETRQHNFDSSQRDGSTPYSQRHNLDRDDCFKNNNYKFKRGFMSIYKHQF